MPYLRFLPAARRLFLYSLLLAPLLDACSEAETSRPPPAPAAARAVPVETAAATAETVTERLRAVGSLTANESVVIRSEIPGRVTQIHFEEGQPVAAGTLLITLDPSEYAAQVAQTEATVALNRLSYQRAADLVGSRMISQQDYDQAQARLKESAALLERNRVLLAKTRLRAPFGGIVGLRRVSPGAYVQPGQDLVNLEDLDPLKIEFRVAERYAPALAAGRSLTLRLDAVPGREFPGEIYAIDPRLDGETRSFALRGRVANTEGLLRPGMFAQVELVVAERPAAVVIPEEAIVPLGEQLSVFKVTEGKAQLVQVQTGLRQFGKVEILDGVRAGETVVTAGQLKLRDGAAVASMPPQDAASAAPAGPVH